MAKSTRDFFEMLKAKNLNEPKMGKPAVPQTPCNSTNTSPVKPEATRIYNDQPDFDADYADAKEKENKKPNLKSACRLTFNSKTPAGSPLTGPMTLHPMVSSLPNLNLGGATKMGSNGVVDMDCSDLNSTQKAGM
jgi:hypothetical protein